MKFEIHYSEEALAQLLALPMKTRSQVTKKVERLKDGFTGNIKKLHAEQNIYRLRSGDFRILFKLNGDQLTITRISDRKESYE